MKGKQMNHWKLTSIVFVFVLVLAAACTPAVQPTTAAPAAANPAAPASKVAFLFMGPTTDQSWNQFGLDGAKKAKAECGIDYAFTESVKQTEFDESFRNYAQQGYNPIIGDSGTFEESAAKIAGEFPKTNFIVINGTKGNGTNLSGIYSDYWQMGYLAGAAACQMTKTNKVAIVTAEKFGMVEPSFVSFPLGAKSCGKDVTTETIVTGSFDDVNKAYEATTALANKGVDVVWHQLDSAASGVFSAAQDKGIYAIGLYGDQSSMSPKTVVASVFVAPTTQNYLAACGKVNKGKADMVNLSNGMQIVMTNLMSQDAQKAVNQTIEDLKSGKIKP
jgi:basic membrane protein A and related proteins